MADAPTPAPRRRRLEPRVYRTRRIAALILMALVVGGLVVGIRALLTAGEPTAPAAGPTTSVTTTTTGSSSSGAGPSTEPAAVVGSDEAAVVTSVAPSGETAPAGTTPASATVAPSSTIPETAVPVTGTPTAEQPARLLIVGDSEAGGFAPYLQPMLDDTGIVDDSLAFKSSTGLARPDFYNWPEQLRVELAEANPDIVIAMFGGNDGQGLATVDGNFIIGTPTEANKDEWIAEYRKRVAEVLDIMLAGGRDVVWIGIPNGPSDLTARIRFQDEAVRAELANYPQVYFVDAWRLFSGRNGNYAPMVIDPRDGEGKAVRSADDGFHLNPDGAGILAAVVFEDVKEILVGRGATL